MTYDILLGDPGYSSWSMRPWLVLDRFDILHRIRWIPLYTDGFADRIGLPPARTVPVLVTPEGDAVRDSLAIVETLAERHDTLPVWPAEPALRGEARSLAAEMHAGFQALRSHCPMNLRAAHAAYPVPDAVAADLARIETLFSRALERSGGPWLCGEWSAADAMFAPVAARVAGYALPAGPATAAYTARHLADPGFRRWRAMGLVRGPDLHPRHYPAPEHPAPWPGPEPLPAAPAEGPAANDTCPYSGEPVTHFMEFDGTVWGFCTPGCRDKTMADPEVWPAFAALRARHG